MILLCCYCSTYWKTFDKTISCCCPSGHKNACIVKKIDEWKLLLKWNGALSIKQFRISKMNVTTIRWSTLLQDIWIPYYSKTFGKYRCHHRVTKLFTSEVFSVFVLQEFLPVITFLFDQSFSLAIFICEFAITQIILENLSHHSTRKRCAVPWATPQKQRFFQLRK